MVEEENRVRKLEYKECQGILCYPTKGVDFPLMRLKDFGAESSLTAV